MNLTDEMLRNAAADVRNAMLDSLPPPEDCEHQFSAQFEQTMCKLIRHQKGWYRILQRVAVVFLALIVSGGIWLSADADASAAFSQWVRDIYENSIVYRFFHNTQEIPELKQFRPAWLPEGYKEESVTGEDYQVLIRYCNAEGDIIHFHYMEMDDHAEAFIFLDGMADPVDVVINGMQGYFYQAIDTKDWNELHWFDTENKVAFQISSSLEKSTMLHIAESIFLSDTTK